MIEVIYKEEKQEAKGNEALFHIPRNIRQIGLVSESYRIYIEDYVYTFLGRLAGTEQAKENGRGCLAVLLGDTNWSEGTTYLFIRGALMVENMEAAADHIDFTDEVWKSIHEEADKYFPEQEIVGWFFSQPQLPVEMTELFGRVHLKHFGGEKVLMLMEPVEREDAFFRYENNYMVRQSGYYIYYEKNPQMQTYMIEKNQEIRPEPAEEVEDEAVKTFRKIIKAKKKEEPEQTEEPEERPSVFSYAATACLAIAVLVVGVNFYNNYRDMQSVRQQSEAVSAVIAQKDTDGITPLPTQGVGDSGSKTPGESDTGQTASDDKSAATGASRQGEGSQLGDNSLQGEDSQQGQASQNQNAQNTSTQGTAGSGQIIGPQSDSASAGGQADSGKAASSSGSGSETGGQSDAQQTTGEQVQNSDVYKEESDVRKARRRAALAAQENKAAAEQGGSSQKGTSSSDSQGQAASGSDVHESYVIRPGDTLFQISMARYGNMETIEEICRLNGISEDEIIYPGQVIVLP